MKLPIYAPKDFLEATCEEKRKICNGCGAKGGTKFPDTMWGLLIVLACNIHDWSWDKSKTKGDLIFSNAIFLYNLTAIIINGSNWIMLLPRISRATKYYLGVVLKGTKSYQKEKNIPYDDKITIKGVFYYNN